MFETLVMYAPGEATISWGCRTAAVCRGWRVEKTKEGRWSVEATCDRADTFQLQQRPLQFNAPRTAAPGGYWCWPVLTVQVGGGRLYAQLGPLEG